LSGTFLQKLVVIERSKQHQGGTGFMPKQNKNSGSGKDGPPSQGKKGGKGGTQSTGARSGGSSGSSGNK